MKRLARLCALMLLLSLGFGSATVFAVQPDEVLDDPGMEQKAREISAELRCLVCQNQSIDDSDAPLARDLRLIVRERLKAGDDQAKVIDFVVARYGEFILLRPPFSAKTYLLWLAPLFLLAGGGYLAYRVFHQGDRKPTSIPTPLSEDERSQLRGILDGKQG